MDVYKIAKICSLVFSVIWDYINSLLVHKLKNNHKILIMLKLEEWSQMKQLNPQSMIINKSLDQIRKRFIKKNWKHYFHYTCDTLHSFCFSRNWTDFCKHLKNNIGRAICLELKYTFWAKNCAVPIRGPTSRTILLQNYQPYF